MWVEETKNGKYKMVERYEDYLTGKTKRVSLTMEKNTAQSRKAAQRALEEKMEKALSSSCVKTKTITLKDLVEGYSVDQQRTVKKSTYTRNFFACKTLMAILGENTLVDRLTAKYIRDRFLTTGKTPGTLNEHLVRLKALLRWGYQNDYIRSIDFLNKIEPFKDTPHRVKIQDKFLESDELKNLLHEMHIEEWRLVTEFLALSGLRFGEAAALLKTDIDLKDKFIKVTKTYDMVNDEVTSPKTVCSIRDVYMQEELESVCRRINARMLRQRLMYGYKDNGLFLSDNSGGHVTYYSYNKYLRENAERVLGRKITAHTLRHTHASLLLEQGVSIDVISRRLGHENSQVTREIYLHVTEKLKEKDNQQIASVKIF